MSVKEYTRVKKRGVIIFRLNGFIDLGKIIVMLKRRHILERVEVEYIMIDREPAQLIIFALFFLKQGQINGAVFPYANYQNNN